MAFSLAPPALVRKKVHRTCFHVCNGSMFSHKRRKLTNSCGCTIPRGRERANATHVDTNSSRTNSQQTNPPWNGRPDHLPTCGHDEVNLVVGNGLTNVSHSTTSLQDEGEFEVISQRVAAGLFAPHGGRLAGWL